MATVHADGGGSTAADVMAFGQEFGRVLSDGRMVGRAEPFAKVFPSSRSVKRVVGLMAWGVLEDIALDAAFDGRGRLVAETNARRIAANLNLSRTTVQNHLAKLREFGFVLHEEIRDDATGRYEVSRYVIDPTACVERFTSTPSGTAKVAQPPAQRATVAAHGRAQDNASSGGDTARQVVEPVGPAPQSTSSVGHAADTSPAGSDVDGAEKAGATLPDALPVTATAGSPNTATAPRTRNWSTDGTGPVDENMGHGRPPVAQFTGVGELGQKRHRDVAVREEHATPVRDTERNILRGRLRATGMAPPVADDLVFHHPLHAVADALDALEARRITNPAGWLVRAITEKWDLRATARQVRAQRSKHQARRCVERDSKDTDRREQQEERLLERWSNAVSQALDDGQLALAIAAFTTPIGGLERRSVGLTRSQLLAWAIATSSCDLGRPLPEALGDALASANVSRPTLHEPCSPLPGPPPTPDPPPVDLNYRIRCAIQSTDAIARR